MCPRISHYEQRNNMISKPSVTNRTARIIEEVMDEYEVARGIAIEMLMESPVLYDNTLEKLAAYDPKIRPNS